MPKTITVVSTPTGYASHGHRQKGGNPLLIGLASAVLSPLISRGVNALMNKITKGRGIRIAGGKKKRSRRHH